MSSISVNSLLMLIKGIPEGLLSVLGLYIFTRTKIDIKKYLVLSLILIIATYLIRFLPIALGVNTVLALLVLIIAFQFAYKTQLSKMLNTIASVICIFILIAVSEVLNMLLLTAIYDQAKAVELLNSSDGLTQSVSSIPSTVFFGLFIFIGYLIFREIGNRKNKNGEAGS